MGGLDLQAGVGCTWHIWDIRSRSSHSICFSFVIDGVITLPIAIYGYLIFPDIPRTTKAFYLTKEVNVIPYIFPCTSLNMTKQEKTLACARLRGKVQVDRPPLTWNLACRILGRWRWYACSLLVSYVILIRLPISKYSSLWVCHFRRNRKPWIKQYNGTMAQVYR